MDLLQVKDLNVCFKMRGQELRALRDINFVLNKGERLGIVGESGAGKSVLGFSILNLISNPGYIHSGQVLFQGQDLAALRDKEIRKIRGNRISMIFQDPMMTLNPVLLVGTQLVETLQAHQKISVGAARDRVLEILKKVKIPSPEERLFQYPHELSGGMRQRVVIANALLTDPDLIIADEPTTALDVTIQAEVMSLILDLCKSEGVGLILVTHDLALVSQCTERLIVMYAGRIIEEGPTAELIESPRHPYTKGLLAALPQSTKAGSRLKQIPGSMPTLSDIPRGCSFSPRCSYRKEKCEEMVPPDVIAGASRVACLQYKGAGNKSAPFGTPFSSKGMEAGH